MIIAITVKVQREQFADRDQLLHALFLIFGTNRQQLLVRSFHADCIAFNHLHTLL